jgi:hypothetical protein
MAEQEEVKVEDISAVRNKAIADVVVFAENSFISESEQKSE